MAKIDAILIRYTFMIRLLVSFCSLSILISGSSSAQDTLPRFSLVSRANNRIFISWTNTFEAVSQISIQRSLDSTKNFKTIITVPDPKVRQNGFVDAKAPHPRMFYRMFIVIDGGNYLFSKSSRPFLDTTSVIKQPLPAGNGNGNKRVLFSETFPANESDELKQRLKKENSPVDSLEASRMYTLKRGERILGKISEPEIKNFYDSIVNKTKDTLVFKTIDSILIKVFVPKVIYKPSQYVYTERDGNITISLPDAGKKQYSIKFFEENESELFDIKLVKDSMLTLDKSNFLHAGWFLFELYEDGKLKERHRFFIPKDF